MAEPREKFRKQLEDIEQRVIQLFPLVSEDIGLATEALLGGDTSLLKVITERERSMDAIYIEIDALVDAEIALQGPVADDLRLLLSVLKALPELERSHDLVVQIAELATHTLCENLSPRARGLVQRMGETCAAMWQQTQAAWAHRDSVAAMAVFDSDEQIDSLHASLLAELGSGAMTLPVTMDMTLVARFYERLGDHARNLARRVAYLAGNR
jgi:phosphate transport system protein